MNELVLETSHFVVSYSRPWPSPFCRTCVAPCWRWTNALYSRFTLQIPWWRGSQLCASCRAYLLPWRPCRWRGSWPSCRRPWWCRTSLDSGPGWDRERREGTGPEPSWGGLHRRPPVCLRDFTEQKHLLSHMAEATNTIFSFHLVFLRYTIHFTFLQCLYYYYPLHIMNRSKHGQHKV